MPVWTGALLCLCAQLGAPAAAQEVAQGVQSLDRYQAEQERLRRLMESRPKAYEDKVMDASELPPAADTDAPPSADQQGMRTFASETRVGFARADGLQLRSATELGQRIVYRQETLNYGDYSLEMDVRATNNPLGLGGMGSLGPTTEKASGRVTLRSIGLPITERLFADTSVGDISSEVTNALSRAYRLSLGTSTVRGVSTRVFDATSDTRAGVGVRGTLNGGPFPGFERTGGETAWLGHSRRFDGGTYAGMQLVRATDVPTFTLTAPGAGVGRTDVSSAAVGIGYGSDLLQPGGHRARAIYLRSHTTDGQADAQGLFLEGGLRLGSYRHEFGVYQAEPGLRYGDYLLASDNRGAYWRMDSSSLRLNWGLGLDLEEQNPKHDPAHLSRHMVGLSANLQYRIDRDRFVGANASARIARHRVDALDDRFASLGEGTRSYYASGFYQTRFGTFGPTRFRATLRRNEVLVTNGLPASGEELEWEQDWIAGRFETLRPELSTTLGIARDRSSGVTETSPTAGVNFRLWVDPTWQVSGNLRYTSRRGNLATSRGLSGSVDTEKVLGDGWTIGAQASLNQAVVDLSAVPGLGGPTVSRSEDKSIQLFVRWEDVRGGGFQGAGLRAPGVVGAGGLGGIVFFDANRDGEQQSSETGVPNVEVVMDGRYRVTTDRNGRFDFPLVGTGRHQLTLTLETVPLPWGAASDRAVTLEVPLRGQVTTRIPVVRVGE